MVELGKLRTRQMFGNMNEETMNRISGFKAITTDRKALHEKGYLDQGLFYGSELVPQIYETTRGAQKCGRRSSRRFSPG
jgi:hypothetical protein